MVSAQIKVDGLREFRRELKRAGDQFPKELRQANLDAAEVVVPEAIRRVPKGPHQGGGIIKPISESIRALATQTRGQVAAGGARTPHAGVYEFGGTLRRYNSRSRTRVQARPFLYPAVEAKADEVVEVYAEALDRLNRKAFPR